MLLLIYLDAVELAAQISDSGDISIQSGYATVGRGLKKRKKKKKVKTTKAKIKGQKSKGKKNRKNATLKHTLIQIKM